MREPITISLDDALVERLRARAQERGHTTEAEAAHVLAEALDRDSERFWAEVAAIRKSLQDRTLADSLTLLREDRER